MTLARSAKAAALALAKEHPEMGKVRAARELRSRGIHISPSGVHAIWKQNGLASGYQRLMSRRREGRGERSSLSDSQHALLQRMRVSRRLIGKAGAASSSHVRREQLMLAAVRVLTEKGYEGASLREICAAAGILPGSLYYHFKSKEDLFVSLHAEGFRQLNEAVDTAIARESDPWARLEAACAAHLTLLVGAEYESLVGGTSLFHPARSPLQRRLNRDRDAYEERFRQMIGALQLPPDVDQTLVRLNLLGALNWTHNWYRPGRKSPRELAHQLVQKILRRSLDAPGRRAEPRKVALS
jgi:TetR/AcrR family transcriptional regulator, cholesterol catabolism regulator